MPAFPIIDTHVHLWDPAYLALPWLEGNALLNHRFGLPEFHDQTAGLQIEAFVYVEVDSDPHYALLEARWAVEQARLEQRLQGIVAHAPLEYGARVRSFLAALTELGPLIKGVRRLVQSEPDPAFCLRPDFVRGVQILPEYGLSCDLGITHVQLASAVALVRACPDTSFVLDHIGKPDIKQQRYDPWREQLHELATLPNVVCKISGMITEADHASWTTADLAPYLAHALAVFGPERVMFGGDWPVSLLAGGYQRWVAALDLLTADLAWSDRQRLWAENARRCYRLAAAG